MLFTKRYIGTCKLIKNSGYLLLLILVLLFSHTNLLSQVQSFTKNDGLSSVIVTCYHVDSKGIVWIGTANGLNAYAGEKWYSISSIEDSRTGKLEQLGSVEAIYEDSKGQIWVSVLNKIFLYKDKYWTVFAETEIDDYAAKDFFEDNRGWIWAMLEHFKDFSDIPEIKFSFLGGTLEMFNGINWFEFQEDVAGTTAYSGQGIPRFYTNMLEDADGNIWIGSLEGVYKFDGKDWIHYDKDDLASEKVLKLMKDEEGAIWAAAEFGLSYFKDNKWSHLTKKDGLCGSTVYELEMDPQGRIWAYTRNNLRFAGINLIENGKCVPFDKHKIGLRSTVEEIIWNEGEIFAFASDGVSLLDSSDSWKRFGKREGLKESKFFKPIQDQSGNIWLASTKSLYKYNDGNWIALKEPDEWEVFKMMVDSRGGVWIGTQKNGLFGYRHGFWKQYSIDNGLTYNEVEDIFEDKKGNIWVITKKGISIINTE